MGEEKRKFADMYLTEGEVIEWYGKPLQTLYTYLRLNGFFKPSNNLLLVGMILSVAGITALTHNWGLIALSGILFLLWVIASFRRWQNTKNVMERTRYMITNKRILILDSESSWHQGYQLSEFQEVKLMFSRNNLGVLRFDDKLLLAPIENAEAVKEIIERYTDDMA